MHSRRVFYQVALDIALDAINHRAIPLAPGALAHVFGAGSSSIQWVLPVACAAPCADKT
jgi:hypothetical protein